MTIRIREQELQIPKQEEGNEYSGCVTCGGPVKGSDHFCSYECAAMPVKVGSL